jgi:hypothetical protein
LAKGVNLQKRLFRRSNIGFREKKQAQKIIKKLYKVNAKKLFDKKSILKQ